MPSIHPVRQHRHPRPALAVGAVVLAVVLAIAGLSSCASIVGGSSQTVSVDTPGCDGARCELNNDKGRYFIAGTPGSVTLLRSHNNLQVVCSRQGATSEPLSVASTTKGMAYGNILLGGVIGAGVDMSTGAAYDYPQLISVPMSCAAGRAETAAAPLRLGLEVTHAEAPQALLQGTPAAGVKVLKVAPSSLAEQWGLAPGDVILRINGNTIRDPDALAALVAAFGADRRAVRDLELTLRRTGEGQDSVLRVQIPAAAASI